MTDTRLVTTAYRHKRPPKKRKAGALLVPTIDGTRSVWEPSGGVACDRYPVQPEAGEAPARGRSGQLSRTTILKQLHA